MLGEQRRGMVGLHWRPNPFAGVPMSFNLAKLPQEQRQAQEDEKGRLFEFWQLNNERAKGEASRIWSEKDKRKSKWQDWAAEQIDALNPPEYQSLVKRELARMG